MCCKITVSVPKVDGEAFSAVVYEIWGDARDESPGVVGWHDPTRRLTGKDFMDESRSDTIAEVNMDGSGHEVEPLSWLLAVKWAVGLYEEALRRGLKPTLDQCGVPCQRHYIASDGETPVDIKRFCHGGLESLAAKWADEEEELYG